MTEKEYQDKYEEYLKLKGTMSNRAIARQIGVNAKTLSNWNKGRKPRSYENVRHVDPEKLEKARQMIEDHASHEEISRTLHISTDTLNKYFPGTAWTLDERIGFMTDIRKITGAKRGINSQTLMRAKKYLEEGYSIPETARQVAVSKDTLRKYFPEFKMPTEESVRKAHDVRFGKAVSK